MSSTRWLALSTYAFNPFQITIEKCLFPGLNPSFPSSLPVPFVGIPAVIQTVRESLRLGQKVWAGRARAC